MPRQQEVYGTVPVLDENKEIIRYDFYPANFVFLKKVVDGKTGKVGYCRVNRINDEWKSLKKLAQVENLQLNDLRTYFNHVLKTNYDLFHNAKMECGTSWAFNWTSESRHERPLGWRLSKSSPLVF